MEFKHLLVMVLLSGAAIGLMMPAARDAEATPPILDARGQGQFERDINVNVVQRAADSSFSDTVVLNREADGHFYADVQVDGRSFRMLVDTGASVVALTQSDALAMGLYWNEDDVQPVARGASGTISGVNVNIEQMNLGDNEAHGVRAIIIPDGLGVSLLGQSFLSTLGNVQITGDRMVLGN